MPETAQTTMLTEIELTEVSCVKAGANPGARIMLAKTDEQNQRWKVGKAGVRYDTEMSLTDRIEDVGEALQEKYGAPMQTYVCICSVFDDAVIFRIGGIGDDDLYSAPYTWDAATDKVEIGDKVPVKVVYESNAAESAEKSAKGAQAMSTATQTQSADVSKALADQAAEFQKKLDAMKQDFEKSIAAERERTEKAEALAKAEKEVRRLNEFVAIGKSQYATIPAEPVRKGEILKALHDAFEATDKAMLDDILKIFKAAENAAQQLTVPTGYSRQVSSGTAEDKLTELAKARAAAGNISFEKAYEKVLLENPALYDEYRAQTGRRQ